MKRHILFSGDQISHFWHHNHDLSLIMNCHILLFFLFVFFISSHSFDTIVFVTDHEMSYSVSWDQTSLLTLPVLSPVMNCHNLFSGGCNLTYLTPSALALIMKWQVPFPRKYQLYFASINFIIEHKISVLFQGKQKSFFGHQLLWHWLPNIKFHFLRK